MMHWEFFRLSANCFLIWKLGIWDSLEVGNFGFSNGRLLIIALKRDSVGVQKIVVAYQGGPTMPVDLF